MLCKFRAALLAALCVVSLSLAGETKKLTLQINRLEQVPIDLDGDEFKYKMLGKDARAIREYDPDPKKLLLQVIGYAPGEGYIVVSSVKNGKLQDMIEVQITFVGSSPVPVPPGPSPVPDPPVPTPTDPLADALKAAAQADKFTGLLDLATGLKAAYDLAQTTTTVDRFLKGVQAALKSAVPEGVPDNVFNILAKEIAKLDSVLPPKSPEGTPITTEGRVKARATFLALYKACERAASK